MGISEASLRPFPPFAVPIVLNRWWPVPPRLPFVSFPPPPAAALPSSQDRPEVLSETPYSKPIIFGAANHHQAQKYSRPSPNPSNLSRSSVLIKAHPSLYRTNTKTKAPGDEPHLLIGSPAPSLMKRKIAVEVNATTRRRSFRT